MKRLYLETKSLPESLQRALRDNGFRARDISLTATEVTTLQNCAGQGIRAYVCVVSLTTGESKTVFGSWGGPNMFNPGNAVDNDRTPFPLPHDCVVIKGDSRGFADLTAHPASLAPLLPTPVELSEKARKILAVYKGIKGGHRAEYLKEIGATADEIDSLVLSGHLSRNKAGAVQITTLGKNAAAPNYY